MGNTHKLGSSRFRRIERLEPRLLLAAAPIFFDVRNLKYSDGTIVTPTDLLNNGLVDFTKQYGGPQLKLTPTDWTFIGAEVLALFPFTVSPFSPTWTVDPNVAHSAVIDLMPQVNISKALFGTPRNDLGKFNETFYTTLGSDTVINLLSHPLLGNEITKDPVVNLQAIAFNAEGALGQLGIDGTIPNLQKEIILLIVNTAAHEFAHLLGADHTDVVLDPGKMPMPRGMVQMQTVSPTDLIGKVYEDKTKWDPGLIGENNNLDEAKGLLLYSPVTVEKMQFSSMPGFANDTLKGTSLIDASKAGASSILTLGELDTMRFFKDPIGLVRAASGNLVPDITGDVSAQFRGYYAAAVKDAVAPVAGQGVYTVDLAAGDMVRIEIEGQSRLNVLVPDGHGGYTTVNDTANGASKIAFGLYNNTTSNAVEVVANTTKVSDATGTHEFALYKIPKDGTGNYSIVFKGDGKKVDIIVTVYRTQPPKASSNGFKDPSRGYVDGDHEDEIKKSFVTAPAPGDADPDAAAHQTWVYSYDTFGLSGSSFTIKFYHSTNGFTQGAWATSIVVDGSQVSDGTHFLNLPSNVQTTDSNPFLMAEIDPTMQLSLADRSHLLSTSEGIYFDNTTIHVYGSSVRDDVSDNIDHLAHYDSNHVLQNGDFAVSLDVEMPELQTHHYQLDVSASVASAGNRFNMDAYTYGFSNLVIDTYGDSDVVDVYAPHGKSATVHGGSGDDLLSGVVGHFAALDDLGASVFGSSAPDVINLYGDDGDDSFDGLGYAANYYGGTGNDWYNIVDATDTHIRDVVIYENEGEGEDTVAFDTSGGVTFDLSSDSTQTITSLLNVTLDKPEALEDLIGTDGNDHLTGNSQDNAIWGMDGDDVIVSSAGFDMLSGTSDPTRTSTPDNDTFVFKDLDAYAVDQIFASAHGYNLLDFSQMSSHQISIDPTNTSSWQTVVPGNLDVILSGSLFANVPTGGTTPIVADTGTTSPQSIALDDGQVAQVDGTIGPVTVGLNSTMTHAVLQLGTITEPVIVGIGSQQVQIDAATGRSTLNLSLDEEGVLHIDRFNTFGTAGASTISAHLKDGSGGKLSWLNESGDTTFTAPETGALDMAPTFAVWSGTLTFSADQYAGIVTLDGEDSHLVLSGTQTIDLLETDDGATAEISGGTLTVGNASAASLSFEIGLLDATVAVTSPDTVVWTATNSTTDPSRFGFSAFGDGAGNVYDVSVSKFGVGNLTQSGAPAANVDAPDIVEYTYVQIADLVDGVTTTAAAGDIVLYADGNTTFDLSGMSAAADVNLNTTNSFQNIIATSLRVKFSGIHVPGTVIGSAGGGTLTGDDNANRLVATGGTTTLTGNGGNDTLTFMGGTATIDPGSGTDTIEVVDPVAGNALGSIDLLSSSGADTLDLSGMSMAANVNLGNTSTTPQTVATDPDNSSNTLTLRLHSAPSKVIGAAGGGSLTGVSDGDTFVVTGGSGSSLSLGTTNVVTIDGMSWSISKSGTANSTLEFSEQLDGDGVLSQINVAKSGAGTLVVENVSGQTVPVSYINVAGTTQFNSDTSIYDSDTDTTTRFLDVEIQAGSVVFNSEQHLVGLTVHVGASYSADPNLIDATYFVTEMDDSGSGFSTSGTWMTDAATGTQHQYVASGSASWLFDGLPQDGSFEVYLHWVGDASNDSAATWAVSLGEAGYPGTPITGTVDLRSSPNDYWYKLTVDAPISMTQFYYHPILSVTLTSSGHGRLVADRAMVVEPNDPAPLDPVTLDPTSAYAGTTVPPGWFSWNVSPGSDLIYDIYANWTADSANDPAAVYQVLDSENNVLGTVQVDQTSGSGWQLIFQSLDCSGAAKVLVTSSGSGHLIADSVKFVDQNDLSEHIADADPVNPGNYQTDGSAGWNYSYSSGEFTLTPVTDPGYGTWSTNSLHGGAEYAVYAAWDHGDQGSGNTDAVYEFNDGYGGSASFEINQQTAPVAFSETDAIGHTIDFHFLGYVHLSPSTGTFAPTVIGEGTGSLLVNELRFMSPTWTPPSWTMAAGQAFNGYGGFVATGSPGLWELIDMYGPEGDIALVHDPNENAQATWSVTGLLVGRTYDVYANWNADTGNSPNAHYYINGNSVFANQQVGNSGLTINGQSWTRLTGDDGVYNAGTTMSITLLADSSGVLVANGLLLVARPLGE